MAQPHKHIRIRIRYRTAETNEGDRERNVHERDCFCGFEVIRIWSEHEIIKHS